MTKNVTWTRFQPKFYGLKKFWSKNFKIEKIKLGPNLYRNPLRSFKRESNIGRRFTSYLMKTIE